MPTVDTLKLKTRLSDSGMPEAQAQVLVEELDEALSTAIARDTATKADVVELRAAIHGLEERFHGLEERFADLKTDNNSMKTDINSMKTDISNIKAELKLLRWMIGVTLTLVAAIAIRLLFM